MIDAFETTDFNSTQFSGTSTEWCDFNKEISLIVQAWDNYLFEVTGVQIDTDKCEFARFN